MDDVYTCGSQIKTVLMRNQQKHLKLLPVYVG